MVVDGRPAALKAHRVAYELFNGPIPEGAEVLHSCDRPVCVQPAHLSVGNHAKNMAEMKERERSTRGERHGLAKLTEADVVWIRSTDLKNAEVARIFQIDPSTVSDIRRHKRWKHL